MMKRPAGRDEKPIHPALPVFFYRAAAETAASGSMLPIRSYFPASGIQKNRKSFAIARKRKYY